MLLAVHVPTRAGTRVVHVEAFPSDYMHVVKEHLARCGDAAIRDMMDLHGDPYSHAIILTSNGIDLHPAFHLDQYFMKDGDVIDVCFPGSGGSTSPDGIRDALDQADVPAVDPVACPSCHRVLHEPGMLRYHPGTLAPDEWAYGLTLWWRWSCCDRAIQLPDTCYHPKGCQPGPCPSCRPDCTCHHARAIRARQEEDLAG